MLFYFLSCSLIRGPVAVYFTATNDFLVFNRDQAILPF